MLKKFNGNLFVTNLILYNQECVKSISNRFGLIYVKKVLILQFIFGNILENIHLYLDQCCGKANEC